MNVWDKTFTVHEALWVGVPIIITLIVTSIGWLIEHLRRKTDRAETAKRESKAEMEAAKQTFLTNYRAWYQGKGGQFFDRENQCLRAMHRFGILKLDEPAIDEVLTALEATTPGGSLAGTKETIRGVGYHNFFRTVERQLDSGELHSVLALVFRTIKDMPNTGPGTPQNKNTRKGM